MARQVRFRVLDGVAIVSIDAPPVNALTREVRAGLWAAFRKIAGDGAVKATVLVGAGGTFSAGLDLQEFDDGIGAPDVAQLCTLIEASDKPVVVAAQGAAYGGGLELMLAGHYRLAAAGTRMGLPEASWGLVPLGGATQRLPRLIGADRSMQLMVSTNLVEAEVAQRIGLLDAVVKGDLVTAAVQYAQKLVAEGKGPRPTRDARGQLTDTKAHFEAVAHSREALADNPLHAPQRVIDCVEAAALLPFEAGLAFEADAFDRCLTHPQSIALRHIFKAERRIDPALIERNDGQFQPVEPMGKSVVVRLRQAWHGAARVHASEGVPEEEIDGAVVAYGFRRGPFGGRDHGADHGGIARRMVAAMMAEGGVCVAQGAVQRPSDIDVLAVHGLGFPRRKGGPMRACQTEGLIALRRDMRVWAETSDLWAVPEVLDAAIKLAAGFDALG